MLSMRHTGGQISGAREYWRTHSWKVPSAMNGCDNLEDRPERLGAGVVVASAGPCPLLKPFFGVDL